MSIDKAVTALIEAVIDLFNNDYKDFISRFILLVLRLYTTLFLSEQNSEPALKSTSISDLGEPDLL